MSVPPSFSQWTAGHRVIANGVLAPRVRTTFRPPGPDSYHLGRQADDPREVHFAQLAGDGPEDAGALRVLFVVNNHHRVAVEADVTAVVPAGRPLGPDHHPADDVARLDVPA